MKSFTVLAILATSFLSAAQATPTPVMARAITLKAEGGLPTQDMAWPQTAARHRAARGDSPTNAELLQRGLKLSKPKRLYQAEAPKGLDKRLEAAPAQASSSVLVYEFKGCRTSGVGDAQSVAYSLTYTSTQDLANQCALLQGNIQMTPGSIPSYFLSDTTVDDNCFVSVQPDGEFELCDTANFAVYAPVSMVAR